MTVPFSFEPRQLGPLIHRIRATDDVAKTLNVPREIAEMILYGLIATNTVQGCDKQRSLIDGDECTLVDLEGMVEWVDVDELRGWLRAANKTPLPRGHRDGEIAKRLPRTVPWDEFCDSVRDACNGWRDKKKRKPAWGFSDKQIKRIAADLMKR